MRVKYFTLIYGRKGEIMNRVTISERFANMWKQSRIDSGKSQDYVAKALGVSKKTVQNWEAGFGSPSQQKGFEWFSVLGVQPLPYYLKLLFPNEYENLTESSNDDEVTEALITFIKNTTPDMRKKLLYILSGAHGSSPVGVVEMITAHLHTPLTARLNVAHNILTNYDVCEATDRLVKADSVPPNLDILGKAYDSAINAVKDGKGAYSV